MNAVELSALLASDLPELAAKSAVELGAVVLTVEPGDLYATLASLKAAGFERCEVVTAVDRGEHLEVVYVLHSMKLRTLIRVLAYVPRETPVIDSVTGLYTGADWLEREVYDLFGIEFTGHPNLLRIMLPLDFEGHPLRKDYTDANIIPRPDYI